jgi:SAM-dependent methyltransferase
MNAAKRLLRVSKYANYNRLTTGSYSKVASAAIVAGGVLEALSCSLFARISESVECNICGWRGRRFLNFHTGYGHVYRHAVCPSCYSHPRHRSYAISLREILSRSTSKLKVLHFAPEPQIARLLAAYQNVDYLSVDIDHRKAMRAEDIRALSFADDSFDVIICIHVFEHIEEDKRAMQEVCRVLRPGGVALLDVPIDATRSFTYEDDSITSPEERTKAFWQWDHVRLYGLDYPQKLKANGFVVDEKRYIESLNPELIRKHGLEVMPNYVCSKLSSASVKPRDCEYAAVPG